MFRLIFRLLARWYLGAARRTVDRYLAGRLPLDKAASRLWRWLDRYGFYHHLGSRLLPPRTGSLEAFALTPGGRLDADPRVQRLVERSWELGLGPEHYRRIRAQNEPPPAAPERRDGAV